MAFCPKHTQQDQNPKFTPLIERKSIPAQFIWESPPGKWLYFLSAISVYVVVQFYPWFKFYFPLFWGMVMHDNEFKTKEDKI